MKVGVLSRAEAQRTRGSTAKEQIPLCPPRLCAKQRNKTSKYLKPKNYASVQQFFVATLSKRKGITTWT